MPLFLRTGKENANTYLKNLPLFHISTANGDILTWGIGGNTSTTDPTMRALNVQLGDISEASALGITREAYPLEVYPTLFNKGSPAGGRVDGSYANRPSIKLGVVGVKTELNPYGQWKEGSPQNVPGRVWTVKVPVDIQGKPLFTLREATAAEYSAQVEKEKARASRKSGGGGSKGGGGGSGSGGGE